MSSVGEETKKNSIKSGRFMEREDNKTKTGPQCIMLPAVVETQKQHNKNGRLCVIQASTYKKLHQKECFKTNIKGSESICHLNPSWWLASIREESDSLRLKTLEILSKTPV